MVRITKGKCEVYFTTWKSCSKSRTVEIGSQTKAEFIAGVKLFANGKTKVVLLSAVEAKVRVGFNSVLQNVTEGKLEFKSKIAPFSWLEERETKKER